jgi:hypothetical protein
MHSIFQMGDGSIESSQCFESQRVSPTKEGTMHFYNYLNGMHLNLERCWRRYGNRAVVVMGMGIAEEAEVNIPRAMEDRMDS